MVELAVVNYRKLKMFLDTVPPKKHSKLNWILWYDMNAYIKNESDKEKIIIIIMIIIIIDIKLFT